MHVPMGSDFPSKFKRNNYLLSSDNSPFESEGKVRISIEINLLSTDFPFQSKGQVRISVEINLLACIDVSYPLVTYISHLRSTC